MIFTPLSQQLQAVPPPFFFSYLLTYLCRYVDATPISPALKTPNSARPRRKSSSAMQKSAPSPLSPRQRGADDDDDEDGGDFGDDFDDFEEGDEDADFGDFDDGFQEPDAQPAASTVPAPAPRAPPISFVCLILKPNRPTFFFFFFKLTSSSPANT